MQNYAEKSNESVCVAKKEKIWGTEYDRYEIIQYVKSVKSKKLTSILKKASFFFISMMYEENWMSERTMSNKVIPLLMNVEVKN